MATSNLTQNVVGIDEAVKASAGDATAGYLDAKVDGTTITVVSDELVRADLTGGVTTVGNAATVVTNANLTGIVTSTGNATAIANGDIPLAKLANGTDGEIPTWDALGVIATVPVGTATHVLTSNGAGAPPTFQAPAGGGGYTVTDSSTFTNSFAATETISQGDVYKLIIEYSTSNFDVGAQIRINNNAANDYSYLNHELERNGSSVITTNNANTGDTRIQLFPNGFPSASVYGCYVEMTFWVRNSTTYFGHKAYASSHNSRSFYVEASGSFSTATPTSLNFAKNGGATVTGTYFLMRQNS